MLCPANEETIWEVGDPNTPDPGTLPDDHLLDTYTSLYWTQLWGAASEELWRRREARKAYLAEMRTEILRRMSSPGRYVAAQPTDALQ